MPGYLAGPWVGVDGGGPAGEDEDSLGHQEHELKTRGGGGVGGREEEMSAPITSEVSKYTQGGNGLRTKAWLLLPHESLYSSCP